MAAAERLLDELDAATDAAIAAPLETLDDASGQMEHLRDLG